MEHDTAHDMAAAPAAEAPDPATPAAPAPAAGAPAAVVDATGRPCPMPVILLAKAVEDAESGASVLLLADDPAAKVDVPVWCRMKSHDLVGVEQEEAVWRFTVRVR